MPDERNGFLKLASNLCQVALLQVSRDDLGVQFQDDEVMADFVVKIACQTALLALIGVPEFDRELLVSALRGVDMIAQYLQFRGILPGVSGKEEILVQPGGGKQRAQPSDGPEIPGR